MKRHRGKEESDVPGSEWAHLTNSLRSLGANEPLSFEWVYAASTIAALAADLTSVAAPSVCTCVVASVDALPLGPLGTGVALNLYLLLPDGGVVDGPPADDDGSGIFSPAQMQN